MKSAEKYVQTSPNKENERFDSHQSINNTSFII